MRIFVLKKELLIKIAAFAVIIAGAALYTNAVTKTEEPVFAESTDQIITNGLTKEKEIAITVDTTFGEDKTDEILGVLDKHGAKATFAVMGAWAKENPEKMKKIISAGHEIISHSMAHEYYNELGTEKAIEDAKAAKEYLKTEFGINTFLLRPPYGSVDDSIINALNENGFKLIKWSIDSKDWRGDDAKAIYDRVINSIKPGDIILFQNNNRETPEAIDLILERLAEGAYKTVVVSEIIDVDGAAA